MTTTKTVKCIGTFALAVACSVPGTIQVLAATVGANGSAWTEAPDRNSVTLVPAGSSVTVSIVSISEQATGTGIIEPRIASVLVDEGVQNSPFRGNLLSAGARGLSFQISGTCSSVDLYQPSTYLFVRGASGREWQAPLSVQAGSTVANKVMLDYTAWAYSNPQAPKPDYASWVADLSSVVSVGIVLWPFGTYLAGGAQNFTVSEFHLVGDNGVTGPAATLTAGQRSGLLNRFGVLQFENVATDRGVDTDGDGVADYYEIMVGTDWNKGDDQFASKIAASASGVVLRWRCNAGVYNVLRADGDINGGFKKVAIDGLENLEPSAAEESAGYMERVDAGATGNGPYFYRVERVGNKQ